MTALGSPTELGADRSYHSTTTRSSRGFELSPRVRSSKIVMRKPLLRLHPLHRNQNCKSKTSVSDGIRYRRCKKPGGNSTLRSHGQRTTITSCAARSPSRNHRSPFVSSRLMRTKYEHRRSTSILFAKAVHTKRVKSTISSHLHAKNNSISYIRYSVLHKPRSGAPF